MRTSLTWQPWLACVPGFRTGGRAPTSRSLAWFVREAWPSPFTCVEYTEGILDEDEDLGLVVASESLVLFGDGMESDRLTLTWGQSVRISRAPRALSLVDPAGLGEG